MKLRGIRRFFESFRNLIYSLRKKPPSPPPPADEDDVTPGTPVSPRHESQTVHKRDLDAIESEPPLPSAPAKDRIKIRPNKKHPKRQEKSSDPCQVDDKSDTASQDSTDFLGPNGDSKSEKKVEKNNKIPMKPPTQLIKHSTSTKDDEKTASSQRLVPASEGDTPDGTDEKPLLVSASSNASLASSVSAKSSELFEKHRNPSSEKADSKCHSTSLEIQAVIEKIPSLADSSQSIPNSDVQSDDVASQKHSSKASLEESAVSISSSNDAEQFIKEKSASPTNSDISLNGPAVSLKSPIPAPRKIKPNEVSLSSSGSFKFSPVANKHGSASLSKNLKDSESFLDSKGTVSRTHSSPNQSKKPSPLNSQNGNKSDLKLAEENEDVDEEADNAMKDEVFQKESPAITISEADEPLKLENKDGTPLGAFCIKPADKSSLKFQNVLSLLPTEEMIDSISENHAQENSDASPDDGDIKSPKSGDCLEKTQPTEIQTAPRSTSDKNNSESGSRAEKPPTPPPKPEKPKLPPAVPTKPKFNKN